MIMKSMDHHTKYFLVAQGQGKEKEKVMPKRQPQHIYNKWEEVTNAFPSTIKKENYLEYLTVLRVLYPTFHRNGAIMLSARAHFSWLVQLYCELLEATNCCITEPLVDTFFGAYCLGVNCTDRTSIVNKIRVLLSFSMCVYLSLLSTHVILIAQM